MENIWIVIGVISLVSVVGLGAYNFFKLSKEGRINKIKEWLLLAVVEAEKYFGVMKRVLSGGIGKNLLDISFKTSQVADSQEHKLLMQLRETRLKKEDIRMDFFRKVISGVTLEDNYLILIGCDSYDVPFKSKDDTAQADASDETYTYLLCAICPVKQAKANLRYDPESKDFHDGGMAHIVAAPELGFLFPAFDGRATNIYNSLFALYIQVLFD